MKTKLRLMMTMLLLTVMGSVWGVTKSVEISPTQALNSGGVSPITIVCAKGDGTSNPAISSGQLRLYQAASGKTTGNTITFSSEKTITSIVFTFVNTMTANNGVFSEGNYSSETNSWSGSTNSVTLTVTGTKSGERIYITKMIVYYEDDNASSTYSVSFDCNGSDSGCPKDLSDVTAGSEITLPEAPTKANYTFSGWNDGTSTYQAGQEYTVNSNVTFTAQWTENGVDYVTLPYVWEGGTKSDLNAVGGITSDGLGTDYAAENAPYRVKLDGTGDYILIKTNERPGYVTVEVKMIGGSAESMITVQGSSDGETFRDIQTLTISGDQNAILILKTTNFFAEDDRYVKLVFTKGSNVGVGPFSISEFAFGEPVDPDVSFENETITLKEGKTFTNTINKPSDLTVSYSVTEGAEYVSVDANTGEVTALAVGQATITASWDAVELLYNEGSVSYVVNVVENTTGKYVKVSNESELYDGLEILILNEDYSKTLGEERSNNFGAADVNIDESGIATPSDEATLLTLKGEPGAWYFLTPDNKYLYAASNSSNHLKAKTTPDDNAKATIVFEEGNATITFQGENGRNTVMFNNSNNPQIFSCYASTATQKPVQIYANTTYEKVSFTTDGYKSYVTRNAIDWGKTLERNSDNVDVHAYQVTALSKTAVTLEELGDGVITSAETPVIVKGKKGMNLLVIASEDGLDISGTNLLKKGSERSESEKDFMYVLQKSKQWSDAKPYEQYNFYPLNPARWNEIGDRQAYLVLAASPDSGGAGSGPGVEPKPIGMRFIHATGEDSLVSEDAGLVDGINDIQQNASLDGEYYSISGVRVAAPTKGLYIVNGKKVLVK